MKYICLVAASAALLNLTSPASAGENEELAGLMAEAQQRAGALGKQLKSELQAAIKAGGPVNGIKICRERAPEIAASLSNEGWSVGRTSLKYRNEHNAPDEYEQGVLQAYLTKLADGASPETLKQGEIVMKEDGSRSFRYMQPIMTGPVCLTCHGGEPTPEVKQALERYYPADKATGFGLGDLRGAFTLEKAL